MNYFKLFSNCILTKGFNNSIILDIQRNKSFAIPNSMVDVIDLLNSKKSLDSVYNQYGKENKLIIDEYIEFLEINELGHFLNLNEFKNFPELSKEFETSNQISNAVLVFSDTLLLKAEKIALELQKMQCKFLQIIFFEEIVEDEFYSLLKDFNNKDFRSIEIIMKFNEKIFNSLLDIQNLNFSITKLIFHSSNENKIYEFSELVLFEVILTNEKIDTFKSCGKINFSNFKTNQKKVLESFNYNTCLHKKISIDEEGFIRNCPAIPKHFGNIKDTSLENPLNHPDFKKYWNVTKDMIDVCKDCEFRHICTDCRAYTERTHFEGDIDLSKPLKCGYNPYTNEWAEWSTNPLKQKAIEYYGMQELIKKDA